MSSLPPFPAPYPDHTGNGNNPNMQFWNGTGTNPGPLLPYFVRPVNNWTQTDRRIHMVAPGATITPENDVRVMPSATVYKRGVWSSPVFDLAPMLGSTTVAQGGVVLGAQVEIKGSVVNGVLVATSVQLEDGSQQGHGEDYELHGSLSALDTTAKTFVLRGVTVSYANVSQWVGLTEAQLATVAKIEVKGSLSTDGTTLVASLIKVDD